MANHKRLKTIQLHSLPKTLWVAQRFNAGMRRLFCTGFGPRGYYESSFYRSGIFFGTMIDRITVSRT